MGRGTSPSSVPSPVGRGHPLPHPTSPHPSRRIWRLDHRACDARSTSAPAAPGPPPRRLDSRAFGARRSRSFSFTTRTLNTYIQKILRISLITLVLRPPTLCWESFQRSPRPSRRLGSAPPILFLRFYRTIHGAASDKYRYTENYVD